MELTFEIMGGNKVAVKVKVRTKPKPVLSEVAKPPYVKEVAEMVRGWDKSKRDKKPSIWGKGPGSLPKKFSIKVKKKM